MKFTTKIIQTGNNTGIEISVQQLEELGGGKKPLVKVSLNNYSYQSAVGKMNNKFMISLSAENRKNANVKGGDTLEITIDFQNAFDKNKIANANFETLAPSKKKRQLFFLSMMPKQKKQNREELIRQWNNY